MHKPATNRSAITIIELIVIVGVMVILVVVLLPTSKIREDGDFAYQYLSNMRQLHLVTQEMASDGIMDTNARIGWPGDTGGSFSNWARQTTDGYLKTNDLCKLLSGPGIIVPPGKIPAASNTAIVLYSVKEFSRDESVFLTTANFTNTASGGLPLQNSAKTLGDKGFIVFRKGGDGSVLLPNQVGQTNIIGTFVPPCGP